MWKPPECTVSGGFLLLTGWFAVSCGWETTLLVLGAAALHELGHILYLKAFVSTLAAWFVGLLLDVNLPGDWQILCLRVLFPVLAMGLCILSELKKK